MSAISNTVPEIHMASPTTNDSPPEYSRFDINEVSPGSADTVVHAEEINHAPSSSSCLPTDFLARAATSIASFFKTNVTADSVCDAVIICVGGAGALVAVNGMKELRGDKSDSAVWAHAMQLGAGTLTFSATLAVTLLKCVTRANNPQDAFRLQTLGRSSPTWSLIAQGRDSDESQSSQRPAAELRDEERPSIDA
jgi:hypothetical protein